MKRAMLAALAAVWAMQPAQGADGLDAAAAFGAREEVCDVSLSPDGKLLALVRALPGQAERVEVVPVAGGMPRPIVQGAPGQRLNGCEWVSATRLVCAIYFVAEFERGINAGYTRRFAVDLDGRNLRQLSGTQTQALSVVQYDGYIADLLPDDPEGKAILMTRSIVKEEMGRSRTTSQREGYALERVDTATLTRTTVEAPRLNAIEYITDGHGAVRIIGERPANAQGYSQNYVDYCYRQQGSRDCGKLSRVVDGDQGFNPVAVDRDLNVAYGFDKVEGRLALIKVSLDGSLQREVVLADPKVDVDGLVRIGRQRRVVGASFATERRQVVMFDPALKKLAAALGRALPNAPSVSFVDASADESKLLLVAGGDTEPGRYYLYDKKTRELNELVSVRPDLSATKLATVKPVTFPAADGTQIPGYLTLPPGSDGKGIPAIVMPHGGPGARDEWGFDWWAQYFANRGFAVLQPNFRGSTGYGDAWFQENGFRSWRTAIGDVNDGGKWLVKQGIAAPGKLAIVGWSYGGYAALQSSVLDPTMFKAIVAVAPVTDLDTLREEKRNYSNFAITDAFIGRGPHLKEGSPAQNAGRIAAPVLMFHGDRDLNVGIGEARLMEARLRAAGKPVELVTYKGLDHQLEDSNARTDMLRKSDAFLRKSLGL